LSCFWVLTEGSEVDESEDGGLEGVTTRRTWVDLFLRNSFSYTYTSSPLWSKVVTFSEEGNTWSLKLKNKLKQAQRKFKNGTLQTI
jgi:hypothetical protein